VDHRASFDAVPLIGMHPRPCRAQLVSLWADMLCLPSLCTVYRLIEQLCGGMNGKQSQSEAHQPRAYIVDVPARPELLCIIRPTQTEGRSNINEITDMRPRNTTDKECKHESYYGEVREKRLW